MTLPFWNKGKVLLTPQELAEILNVSIRTIYNGTGKNSVTKFPIPHLKVNSLIRFHVDDVQEYLKNRFVNK